jgi:DNA polymerase alpha subunit A
MSSRAKKAAALAALKNRRAGLLVTSRTEEYEVPEEEDVYETMEEDEYRKLVESRREREDFVVDDGKSEL